MFFKSFQQNLRQGIPMGLIALAVGGMLGLDLYLCVFKMEGSNLFKLVMTAALVFLTILYRITMLYVWAVIARFEKHHPPHLLKRLPAGFEQLGSYLHHAASGYSDLRRRFLKRGIPASGGHRVRLFWCAAAVCGQCFKLRPVLDECQEAARGQE